MAENVYLFVPNLIGKKKLFLQDDVSLKSLVCLFVLMKVNKSTQEI